MLLSGRLRPVKTRLSFLLGIIAVAGLGAGGGLTAFGSCGLTAIGFCGLAAVGAGAGFGGTGFRAAGFLTSGLGCGFGAVCGFAFSAAAPGTINAESGASRWCFTDA